MKVLVVRFSSIGDIVLTTPVVRCIKQQLNAEVHFVTKMNFKQVLVHNPHISKLHLIDDSNKQEIVDDLKKEQFDWIIDLHNNIKSRKLTSQLNAPVKRFFKANIEKWLYVNFKINKLPKVHIVDRYLDTVSHLGVTNDKQGLDFFLPPNFSISEERLPAFYNEGYTGFVIGGAHQTKCLPVHKIAEAIDKMTNKNIVLLGGPDDTEKAKAILEQIKHPNVFDGCGKFNLLESAWLVKQASQIITHDTGLMHIASAFQKSITSVWGNTVPEFGMYPYLPENNAKQHIVEVKDLNCRPCSKIGYKKCPKGHFKCMELIDINELVN